MKDDCLKVRRNDSSMWEAHSGAAIEFGSAWRARVAAPECASHVITAPIDTLSDKVCSTQAAAIGSILLLISLVYWGITPLLAAEPTANTPASTTKQPPAAPAGMSYIPGGSFLPPFRAPDRQGETVVVRDFFLDQYPITNRQFFEFVRCHPRWQKANAPRLFADQNYLAHWPSDLESWADGEPLWNSPATHISWFAAKEYCRWRRKRLPLAAEWEFAAAASETEAIATATAEFKQQILSWYSRPTPKSLPAVGQTKNYHGVYDMHGLIWEWVVDFNAPLSSGDFRGDTSLDPSLFCAAGSADAVDAADYAAFMRFAFRGSVKASYTIANLGFRCAADCDEE